ncbi:MAG: type II toxin-antitoxin system RelB/DinJ family antitoxin [Fusobacteriaceae bacterium]|nr:type II toxin-antitoxin system RelB/DinJ family antitoxin [Fusobacteriaceae bacterium]
MATIQVRIDEKTKASVDSLFSSLGMDTSTAVRMFLAAALSTQ